LASHGYVVVGIDHPGNSGPIALLNGQVLQPVAELDLDFRTKTLQEIESLAEEELSKETEDTLFVLDQMERLNEDSSSPFFHRLDTRSVGAFGHSFGGAVAAEACLQDSRIESALVLSGSLFGRVQREGLPKMIMMLEEDPPQFSESELQRSNEARIDDALDIGDDEVAQRSPGYRIFLHGSSHTGFTDHSLFSNFESLTGGGKTPPYRQFSIIRAYAVAFFDKTLRGIESPILAPGAHPFPEASFKVLPNGRSSAPLTAP
jgi:pimeloyl-ACP methyl ester carboxylesterase